MRPRQKSGRSLQTGDGKRSARVPAFELKTLPELHGLRGRAEGAAPRVFGNLAEALGALLGGRVGRRLLTHALYQRLVRQHDQEVDDRADDHKRQHRVDELAEQKLAVVDREVEL